MAVAVAFVPPPVRAAFALAGVLLVGVAASEKAWSRCGRSAWPVHAAAAGVPVVLLLALYGSVLGGFFMGDDPAILWACAERGVPAYFVDPSAWRAFSQANFTPWVIASFGADWHVFGLAPLGYYWHQLTSLAIVVVLGYAVVARFHAPWVAALGTCLFVASVPAATTSQWLMTRHYVEGLAFALLAVLLFLAAVARGSTGLAWCAAAAYLAATSAKELYVPLVVVLPFLAAGAWRQRLRSLLPSVAALVIYVAWRMWMLGAAHFLSGYGSLGSGQRGGIALRLQSATGWTLPVVWAVLGVVLLAHALQRPRRGEWPALGTVVLACAAVGPLLPVLGLLEARMLLAVSFLLAVWFAVALSGFARGAIGAAAVVAIGVAALAVCSAAVAGSPPWNDRSSVGRYRDEGRFMLEQGRPGQTLLSPVGPPWYYKCLGKLRQKVGGGESPSVCYDVCFCKGLTGSAAVELRGGMLTPLAPTIEGCAGSGAPLSAEMTYDPDGTLSWRLGPYRVGEWSAFDEVGYATIVPPEGATSLWLSEPASFAFRYTSPEGWFAVSPPLVVDPSKPGSDGVARVSWGRPGSPPH